MRLVQNRNLFHHRKARRNYRIRRRQMPFLSAHASSLARNFYHGQNIGSSSIPADTVNAGQPKAASVAAEILVGRRYPRWCLSGVSAATAPGLHPPRVPPTHPASLATEAQGDYHVLYAHGVGACIDHMLMIRLARAAVGCRGQWACLASVRGWFQHFTAFQQEISSVPLIDGTAIISRSTNSSPFSCCNPATTLYRL